jgi:WD40 repeat protein
MIQSFTSKPVRHRQYRVFWRSIWTILYLSVLGCIPTGCQLFEQIPEIADINLDTNPPPLPVIPRWEELPTPTGPRVSGHTGAVIALKGVGSPTKGIYSLGTDQNILYWDLASGKANLVRKLGGSVLPSVGVFGASRATVAYSSGNDLVVACVSGCTNDWTLNRLRARAKTVDFHNEDSSVLIGSVDGKVSRWKYLKAASAMTLEERDKCLELYAGHQSVVSAVAAHPFNRAFFTGDWNGSFYAWLPYDSDDYKGEYDRNLFTSHFYAAPGTFTKGLRDVDRGIIALSLSRDGTVIALGSENGFVETWSVRGFEKESRYEAHRGRILSIDLSPSGKRVATLGRDGLVRLFEIVDDNEFGISATALKKRLDEVASYEVPEGVVIKYVSEKSVVVGTSTGKLLEADATGDALQPTPTPTPKIDETAGVDTDY